MTAVTRLSRRRILRRGVCPIGSDCRSLLLATTDCGDANTHSVDDMPTITAGRANGTMKNGLHLVNDSDTVSRVSLTVMRALKMPVSKFGTQSNDTSRPISEVFA